MGRPPKNDEPTVPIGVRLPASIVAALDDESARLAPPGIRVSRTDVVRVLLEEALAARSAVRRIPRKK